MYPFKKNDLTDEQKIERISIAFEDIMKTL
jgi:hypothetical protein